MSNTPNIEIDDSQLQEIANFLVATDKQVETALKRAITRTARNLRTKASSSFRKAFGINAKFWKRRIRLYASKDRSTNPGIWGKSRVWVGLDPVRLIHANPRQTKRGVRTRATGLIPGAFIATLRSGRKGVFKRKGPNPKPLIEQTAEIEKDATALIEHELFSQAEDLLAKNFERELNWETHENNPKNKRIKL